ncbi:MAG: YtxH domain-containing protein [Chloroflexota bacterium]
MTTSDSATGFGLGLLAGAIIGVAIGFLYAPKSGRETRAMLKERAEDIRDQAEDVMEKAKEKVAQVKGKLGKAAEDFAE